MAFFCALFLVYDRGKGFSGRKGKGRRGKGKGLNRERFNIHNHFLVLYLAGDGKIKQKYKSHLTSCQRIRLTETN